MTSATAERREVTANDRELIIMDRTGDTKISWSPDRPAEVTEARGHFDRMKKHGYLAYSVNRDGDKGTVVREFDPEAGKLILAPPTVGG